MAITTAEKIRENGLRNAARRQGYQIVKSGRREPRALDYGTYMIVDPNTSAVEGGGHGGMSLDDAEKWLRS